MSEPKPMASLTSGLLARKGQAKPAMRPQGFGAFGMSPNGYDDLGWNDMGADRAFAPQPVAEIVPIAPEIEPEPAVEATPPTVIQQQDELERSFVPEPVAPAPRPVASSTPRAAPGSKGKAAFTLRLDPERHLKLRLASAMQHKSAQAIVIAALDEYLAQAPVAADANATC